MGWMDDQRRHSSRFDLLAVQNWSLGRRDGPIGYADGGGVPTAADVERWRRNCCLRRSCSHNCYTILPYCYR